MKSYLGGVTADNYKDSTPIRDLERDISSETFNRAAIAAVAECARRARPGTSALAIPFEIATVLGNTTDQPTLICGWVAQTNMQLFKDATLVGVTAQYGDPITAGQLTVRPRIAGVDCALQATLSSGGDIQFTRSYQVTEQALASDKSDASANDVIDVLVDTDATFAPTVRRLNGHLWFNIGEEEEI
jgi:hypothetical protein